MIIYCNGGRQTGDILSRPVYKNQKELKGEVWDGPSKASTPAVTKFHLFLPSLAAKSHLLAKEQRQILAQVSSESFEDGKMAKSF